MTNIKDISKDDFKTYVDCQISGITNMFDVNTVRSITGLSKDKIFVIMKNYSILTDKWGLRDNRKL